MFGCVMQGYFFVGPKRSVTSNEVHVAYFAGIFEAFFESDDGVFFASCTTQIYDNTIGLIAGAIEESFD